MCQNKTTDRSDIEDVFNELIEENGQVTSKEVKEELRSRGFWATQAIVGVAVREIADEQGTDWDFNGTYRTYHERGTKVKSVIGSQPVPVSAQKPKRAPLNSQDRVPIDDPVIGDWECTDLSGNSAMYFVSSLTTNQARYAYSLQTGVAYINVRSCRVEG